MLKRLSLIKGFPWAIPPKNLHKVRKTPEVNSFESAVSKVFQLDMQFLSSERSAGALVPGMSPLPLWVVPWPLIPCWN